ncbi:MAG: bifunctional UDP-N-acetylmuramoyl-tripeptide:D-alanyl-D-alanine ligase/alanine racemase, partial [Flavobacterium sp.]
MGFSLKNITAIVGGQWQGENPDASIDNVSIDSRSLQNGGNTLFFALSGPNNDAHKYIPELVSKGVSAFIVTKIPSGINANFIKVDDTLTALQTFAGYHRNEFDFPVIGITGSNGKTIVKEWLNFLLSPDFNIIRSPKSYNSQVGVALSVLGINQQHNLGIFEAGISLPGEMAKLEPMIKPTIGVLTNIGSAHDEGFGSQDEKVSEKLRLFSNAKIVICKKDLRIEKYLDSQVFSWSYDDKSADVFISKNTQQHRTYLNIEYRDLFLTVEIPFTDSASVENAVSCLMVLLYLNYDDQTIRERMSQLFPVEMRLKVKNGTHNSTIIDDSYSSDFQSLKIALDFLESQKHHGRKTVILSDIYQSGLSHQELYE